ERVWSAHGWLERAREIDSRRALSQNRVTDKNRHSYLVISPRATPNIGEQKKGDLAFLRVHMFKMNKQLTLLGYSFDDGALILELMALGAHESFYRDIKRKK
ncbi:MAG TPA: type II toxin-antitoxin system RelE/ParE family toxin, partial [Marinagarivorans sp.]